MKSELYKTKLGRMFVGDFVEISKSFLLRYYKNKFNLILTSPPFPLNKKKRYGNLQGKGYRDWFVSLATIFSKLLAHDGSLVIEIGNTWENKRPVQSLLHLECLFELVKNSNSDLRLIQEFICYNPSRLPSPAQWVTVNRFRAVDSYTHVWWIAKRTYRKRIILKYFVPILKACGGLLRPKDLIRENVLLSMPLTQLHSPKTMEEVFHIICLN